MRTMLKAENYEEAALLQYYEPRNSRIIGEFLRERGRGDLLARVRRQMTSKRPRS